MFALKKVESIGNDCVFANLTGAGIVKEQYVIIVMVKARTVKLERVRICVEIFAVGVVKLRGKRQKDFVLNTLN